MVNINRIKDLAKSKGISITYICEQFGAGRGYLNDVARGKNTMSDERIFKVAKILDTTYEYLTDMTDDPAPDSAAKKAESPEERLIHTVIERVMQLPPEQVEILQNVFESKEEDFTRAMSVLKAMKG